MRGKSQVQDSRQSTPCPATPIKFGKGLTQRLVDEGRFEPSCWSSILQADARDSGSNRRVLAFLLIRYRRPIVLCLRAHLPPERRTYEQAEHLAEAFTRYCLKLDLHGTNHPHHGSLRAFVKEHISTFLRDHPFLVGPGKPSQEL